MFEHELKNAYIWEYVPTITENYTISNIPTTDSNVYLNVAKSWYTIQSVTFKFTSRLAEAQNTYSWFHISSNSSNRDRYWLVISWNYWIDNQIRWRLNSSGDTYFRYVTNWYISWWSSNSVEFTIKRNGTWTVNYNWTITTYTADSTELNIIQTIMNLSNMNVYAYDQSWCIVWNSVGITVEYL